MHFLIFVFNQSVIGNTGAPSETISLARSKANLPSFLLQSTYRSRFHAQQMLVIYAPQAY